MNLLRFFASLLIVGVGESFSPANVKSPIIADGHVALLQLRAIKHIDKRRNVNQSRQISPRRVPPNKRTAIRWVIQGVERCLAEDVGKDGEKTYSSVNDASLIDALHAMVNAYNQKDVLDAEKRLKVLMRNPKKYSPEVNERVIKATAMAGLASFSSALLKEAFLHDNGETIPSSMAYTAVLNALRKVGELDRMEEILTDLATVSRRVSLQTGEKNGIAIVAFNTYLAAICDAVVQGLPFSPSAASIRDDEDYEEDMKGFNFTSLESYSKTSAPEKYLSKAANLLRGDIARTRFAVGDDPDEYSYNQVLNAAAKCSKLNDDDRFTKSIILSCLKGMKDRGIQPNMFTYNARLQATLASDNQDAAVQLIDQIISDQNAPDRYTINFMLIPFINADRRDDIWSTLTTFYEANIESNSELVSSAFEAFLVTIVQSGEIEFARDLFQHFFLKLPKHHKRVQVSRLVHVINVGQPQLKMNGISDESSATKGSTLQSSHLPPKTKHFNILLGGYSKAYQSTVSKARRSVNQATKYDRPCEPLNGTIPDVQKAFDLLEIMIDVGVPLDGFTVTSLMTLPYSAPENITSLLSRIEPQMMVEFSPAAYRSIISAYGKVGDPSSACWMFGEMTQSHRNQARNVECWNAVLGALARCDVANLGKVLDIPNSQAARARKGNIKNEFHPLMLLVDGRSVSGASMAIVDLMRNGTVLPEGYSAPKPNSQTYCLVASALSSGSNSGTALDLFRNATEEGVAADGRFLNAVLRCFGDDIESALNAWKSVIGPAAAAYERRSNKGGANVIAAYNGLVHVCGRAIRPDIATRIAYAMNKAGVEPNEVTLNSYLAGKRIALGGNEDGKSMSLTNQYETLLSVECTKYNTRDKRRVNEKKIRIILGR